MTLLNGDTVCDSWLRLKMVGDLKNAIGWLGGPEIIKWLSVGWFSLVSPSLCRLL